MAEDVVARRDHICARVKDAVRGLLGDSEPSGGVLAIDDHQVGLVALAKLRHHRGQPVSPGPADHVTDEQQPHHLDRIVVLR